MSGKVLVTGASGLAGASLVRMLLEQGRSVRALVHKDIRALQGLDIELFHGDILNIETVRQALKDVDVVYHLAGSISLASDADHKMQAINITGTQNLVECCFEYSVSRLVYYSSIDALQHEPYNVPIDETRPLVDIRHHAAKLGRISPYDHSKAEGERKVLDGIRRGLDAIIIRPTALLGPYDSKPSFQGQALIQLARGKIPALVKGGFDWVDVRDVAAGAIQAEKVAQPGAVYNLSGNWHTLREVAIMVAEYTHRSAPLVTVPMWMAYAFEPFMQKIAHFNGKQPIYTKVMLNVLRGKRYVSSEKARRELGYSPRPLKETIHDTITWFCDNGYLR